MNGYWGSGKLFMYSMICNVHSLYLVLRGMNLSLVFTTFIFWTPLATKISRSQDLVSVTRVNNVVSELTREALTKSIMYAAKHVDASKLLKISESI